MNLFNENIEDRINTFIINAVSKDDYTKALIEIANVQKQLYENIPDNKRISYGIVHTIKILSEYIFNSIVKNKLNAFEIGANIYNKSDKYEVKGVALGILSFYGLNDFKKVLPFYELAALSEEWELREFSQMFFRKLINKHPDEIREYLLGLVNSKDSNIRRFIGETLRPVQENKWFYKNPDYSLSILKHLFKEKVAYPRTSVGNNLSDYARQLPELVYGLVGELVESGDKNSYWIAYRACRNLVKKEPLRVMDLLKIDEYKYKTRVYKRNGC